MLISIYENAILTGSVFILFFHIECKYYCSHVCIIYPKIYEEMSSGGLGVSLSIYLCLFLLSNVFS